MTTATSDWFCGGCGQTDPAKRCVGCFAPSNPKGWSLTEIIAKAMAHRAVGDPHAIDHKGEPRWKWFLDDAEKFVSVFGYAMKHITDRPAESVSVKPLKWRIFCSNSLNRCAATPFGEYVIQKNGEFWDLWHPGNEDANGRHRTVEDAENSANANFEERIRSVLVSEQSETADRLRVTELEAENFRLAAGQCIHPNGNGLIGHENGSQICAMEARVKALETELVVARTNDEVSRDFLDVADKRIKRLEGLVESAFEEGWDCRGQTENNFSTFNDYWNDSKTLAVMSAQEEGPEDDET